MSHLDTSTRIRFPQLVPTWSQLADSLALLLLGALALAGLAPSFSGWGFWVIGTLGLLIGLVVSHVTTTYRLPMVAPVVVVGLVFLALGGPLCLRAVSDASVLPGPGTLALLADQAVFGWKDLLTTLPPVDGDGPLLVLPWLLGLLAGAAAGHVSRQVFRRSWVTASAPLVPAVLLLGVVVLVGVRRPQSLLLQGALFSGLTLAWLALRSRRASATVRGGSRGVGRVVAGLAMLGLAAGLAVPVAGLVSDGEDRLVLRTYVEPPFDIGRYPSPLASFRNYVDLQGRPSTTNVYDKPLFTVDGVPVGTRVRIATLDQYDGMVWGATNDALPGDADDSFQRVSSVIRNPVPGEEVTAEITVGEGYAGVWLPVVGALQGMEFQQGDTVAKAETFRYNLATSTAVVPSGVHPGDRYSFTAVLPPDTLDEGGVASAERFPSPERMEFLDKPAEEWTEEAQDPLRRVLAAAEHLKTEGKYSDGVKKSERQYHPGHGINRLGDGFVNAQAMVGNDEQYAAVMALLANRIGVPARVVMGATVPESGVVHGEDVSAWVELLMADGTWRTLPTDAFMSEVPPAEQQPQTEQPMTGTVVPPPAPIPPPSTLDDSDADLKSREGEKEDDEEEEDEGVLGGLPRWVVLTLLAMGIPLLLLVLALGAIVGLKSLRRRRRLSAATISTRVVGAWRELVDHARDLGQPVPVGVGVTRREQSGTIGADQAPALARRADGHVFGPSAPEAATASAYWEAVEQARRTMSAAVGRRRRLRAAVNLTTFRPTGRRRD